VSSRLEVRGIWKRFDAGEAGVQALEEVSFKVNPGELVMLVGPSGCGKSTLLNLVAGLEKPDRGEILVDGQPIDGPGPDRSLVFQDGALFPWLSVQKNVEFGLRQAKVPTATRRDKAQQMLEKVGLKGFESRAIHELSGGMRQRVALARSLVLEPRVLLMDEAFSALDALTREDLYLELQGLQQEIGTTVLFVTHNVREAVTLGDRVILMSARPGRVQEAFDIDILRPRQIDDADVARTAQTISAAMKRGPQIRYEPIEENRLLLRASRPVGDPR